MVKKETSGRGCRVIEHRHGFLPLSKLVNGHNNVLMTAN